MRFRLNRTARVPGTTVWVRPYGSVLVYAMAGVLRNLQRKAHRG